MDRSPSAPPPKPLRRPMLAAGSAVAILSLTAAPTPKTLARLEAAGVSVDLAAVLLHAAPVVFAVAGLGAGIVLARGRGLLSRGLILAGAGGIIGFVTALCLDLFVGVPPLIERVVGPTREATSLDIAAWALAVLSILLGLQTLIVAQLGTPAMRAMNFEGLDEEHLEVRPRDRGVFRLSAAGCIGQGVSIGALAVLHQMEPGTTGMARGVAAGCLTLGVLAFAWSSWRLWAGMDELLRRTVMDAYGWSCIVATAVGMVWAALEGLGMAPPLTAYALIVMLVSVQTAIVLCLSTALALPAPTIQEIRR